MFYNGSDLASGSRLSAVGKKSASARLLYPQKRILLMKTALAVVALVWFASCCGNARAQITAGKVFNVREHGAAGDAKSLDTGAIQKAFDACGEAGGGTVVFPPGTYWLRRFAYVPVAAT